jgi:hypothetical protein
MTILPRLLTLYRARRFLDVRTVNALNRRVHRCEEAPAMCACLSLFDGRMPIPVHAQASLQPRVA